MSDKVIEVWMPGSVVVFDTGELEKETVKGVITNARIQGAGCVDYQVVYWKDGDRKTAWVEELEFTADPKAGTKRTIGFKNGE